MLLSYNKLSELTGVGYRTIKSRLEIAGLEPESKKGRAFQFEPKKALPIIYGVSFDQGELNLTQERAQLAREQTRRLERENDIEERKVIPFDEIGDLLENVAKQIVSLLESLPLNIKRRVPILKGRDIEYIRLEINKCRNLCAKIQVKE